MDTERRFEPSGQALAVSLRRERYLAQLARFRRAEALYQRAATQYHELVHALPRLALARSSESPFVLRPEDRAVPDSQQLSASRSTERDGGRLTARQREIAGLLGAGYTNKQIAELLVVTPGTVANHVAHILNRLDLRNRAQIGVWAVRHGLVDPNDAVAAPGESRRVRGVPATRRTVPRP